MQTVSTELINKIYAHVNCVDEAHYLIKDIPTLDKIVCALRTLEDAALAVEYYLSNEYPNDFRGKYLFTYGLLQALFLQEDAANSLSKVLCKTKIDFKSLYPEAFKIREIRNDIIGHPTNRDNGCHCFYLVQCSMTKNTFSYTESVSNIGEKEIQVNVDLAIDNVSSCINSILREIVLRLDLE